MVCPKFRFAALGMLDTNGEELGIAKKKIFSLLTCPYWKLREILQTWCIVLTVAI